MSSCVTNRSRWCQHVTASVAADLTGQQADWIEQGLTSHQTHYRSYRGRGQQAAMQALCAAFNLVLRRQITLRLTSIDHSTALSNLRPETERKEKSRAAAETGPGPTRSFVGPLVVPAPLSHRSISDSHESQLVASNSSSARGHRSPYLNVL